MKRKIGLLVLAGMLLTVSAAAAAPKTNYTLKNKAGEVIVEAKTLDKSSPDYKAPSMEEQIRSLTVESLADKQLKEGTAAIFYVVENNPDKKIDIEYKSINYTNLSQFRKKMAKQPVKILDQLSGNYKFQNADVSFLPVLYQKPLTPEEEAATAEKLLKQAEEAGKDYAVMPIKVSNDYWRINSTYKKGKHDIRVTISKTPEKQTIWIPENDDSKREKIKVKGVEMIYTDFGSGKNIQWIYDVPSSKEAVHYHIETINPINKNQLIKLAEAYLK
ncbi:hypothetical protein EHV15_17750 [Paenibacillus oralis]|uniref:DUF4367 domain-containing protein n=1 Tax=Paenibacillus oralis TaxID=2490856 RepID=A0A3P3U2J3_9BACL|nr:hypothetical protein [Paenibacillus oralis]RRJ64562.1 hypothetical protein EHV15_17750 [Paenibacillus oralis]